jgi:hypothetical protein
MIPDPPATVPVMKGIDPCDEAQAEQDADGDGVLATWEERLSLDPLLADSDGDGTSDGAEDFDHDGLTNLFEIRGTVTTPFSRDSDGDGLRDPAEDPDGDGLSNAGEQLVGTSPADADTDGDTIPDGQDDLDGDGRADGIEQDARPVPPHLRPSLVHAADAVPVSYRHGCHAGTLEVTVHPCVYGDARAGMTIALFGDSRAAQWLPALIGGETTRAWRIVSLTKSACPAVDVRFRPERFRGAEASCHAWRLGAERWLRSHPPDIVLMSSSRTYLLTDRRGRRIVGNARDRVWKRGLARTLRALPRRATPVVLADTPLPRVDVPVCLRAHPRDMARCETSRRRTATASYDAVERRIATAMGAGFATLTGQVCPYDPCPVVVGDLLVWRDGFHLSARYALALAPSMDVIVREIVAHRA